MRQNANDTRTTPAWWRVADDYCTAEATLGRRKRREGSKAKSKKIVLKASTVTKLPVSATKPSRGLSSLLQRWAILFQLSSTAVYFSNSNIRCEFVRCTPRVIITPRKRLAAITENLEAECRKAPKQKLSIQICSWSWHDVLLLISPGGSHSHRICII